MLFRSELHAAEADKDAVGHGAVPNLGLKDGLKAEFVPIGLHVQQQTAAGDKVHLKDIVGQGRD